MNTILDTIIKILVALLLAAMLYILYLGTRERDANQSSMSEADYKAQMSARNEAARYEAEDWHQADQG
jgi:hypothetical protein